MPHILSYFLNLLFNNAQELLLDPLTFLRPLKNGSDSSAALAVGGVGGRELQTPNVAISATIKAGPEMIHNYKNITEFNLSTDYYLPEKQAQGYKHFSMLISQEHERATCIKRLFRPPPPPPYEAKK